MQGWECKAVGVAASAGGHTGVGEGTRGRDYRHVESGAQ